MNDIVFILSCAVHFVTNMYTCDVMQARFYDQTSTNAADALRVTLTSNPERIFASDSTFYSAYGPLTVTAYASQAGVGNSSSNQTSSPSSQGDPARSLHR